MSISPVEQEILREKEKLAKLIVLAASKISRIDPPEIKIWDGYCPEASGDEVAHFHYAEPNGVICISRYRLRSMNFDDIENTMIHELTHSFIDNHGSDFKSINSKIRQAVAEYRLDHHFEETAESIKEPQPTRSVKSVEQRKIRLPKNRTRFYILTTKFNGTMNDFIVTYDKRKIVDRYWTGGVKDIVSSQYHPFKPYCDFLNEFREMLFRKSLESDSINLDDTKQEFSTLLNFYKSTQIDNKTLWNNNLEPVLLNPLREFFKSVDGLFNTDYFEKKIIQIFIDNSGKISFINRIRASLSKKYRQKLETELMSKLFPQS